MKQKDNRSTFANQGRVVIQFKNINSKIHFTKETFYLNISLVYYQALMILVLLSNTVFS
jgi:hypothetical protein